MAKASLYLTNKCHVAVHLFSNRSQMTSTSGRKKVAHEAIAECVTDVLTTFLSLLRTVTEQTQGNIESFCFIALDCSKVCSSLGIFQVINANFCLYLTVNSFFKTFCGAFFCTKLNNRANIFKTDCHVGQNYENDFLVTSSVRLSSDRSWATTNHSARSIQFIV